MWQKQGWLYSIQSASFTNEENKIIKWEGKGGGLRIYGNSSLQLLTSFNSLPPKCFVLATEFKSQGETNIYANLLAPLVFLAIHKH